MTLVFVGQNVSMNLRKLVCVVLPENNVHFKHPPYRGINLVVVFLYIKVSVNTWLR